MMTWKAFLLALVTLSTSSVSAGAQTTCDECFAVIKADGKTVSSRGLDSAERTGEGRYRLSFARDVRDCAYSTALASPKGQSVKPGIVAAEWIIGNLHDIAVKTFTLDGVPKDRPFHLTLACAD